MFNLEYVESLQELGQGILDSTNQYAATIKMLGMATLIIVTVISLIICFLGLKIERVLFGAAGLILGAAIGMAVANLFKLDGDGILVAVIVVISALLFAALAGFLRRFGAFLLFFIGFGAVLLSLPFEKSPMVILIMVGVSLVLAILTAIFPDIFVIIVTAVLGGLSAALAGFALIPANLIMIIPYAAGVLLIAGGIIVQLIMLRRKKGVKKPEKTPRRRRRGRLERESEIEAARKMLDDDDVYKQ
jgi:hypothetical protein